MLYYTFTATQTHQQTKKLALRERARAAITMTKSPVNTTPLQQQQQYQQQYRIILYARYALRRPTQKRYAICSHATMTTTTTTTTMKMKVKMCTKRNMKHIYAHNYANYTWYRTCAHAGTFNVVVHNTIPTRYYIKKALYHSNSVRSLFFCFLVTSHVRHILYMYLRTI